jgi:outer membrane protein TolC
VRLARREIWPDLQVGVSTASGRWKEDRPDGQPHAGHEPPIFAGSRQLAMRREASAMRQMAEADLAAMQADTRGRVAELYASAERAAGWASCIRDHPAPDAHHGLGRPRVLSRREWIS